MYSQSVKIFFLGLVSVLNFPTISGQARIAGGQVIGIDKAPFTVQLRDEYGNFMCGGTLVTPNHVLTAAHCFDFNAPPTVTIVGGASTIHEAGVQRKIVKTSIPPEYTRARLQKDVAIVKLDRPMTGPNIHPIKLCNRDMKPGDLTHMFGWGKTSLNSQPSEHLRTYSAAVVFHGECARTFDYGSELRVTNTMFCSFAKDKKVCQHDSGSPALYDGQLCGIYSWGAGCENSNVPAVFTSIHAMRSFIDNALKS